MPVLMHRDRMSPNAASLCAILSSTALIVLVMLCRARSEADAACDYVRRVPRRATAPSSARRSLLPPARRARRFPAPWLLPILRAARRAGVGKLTLACSSSISPASPRLPIWMPAFSRSSSPRGKPRAAASIRFRRLRAGRQFHRPDRARGIQSRDDAADERGSRGPWCPSDERIFRRSRQSSTRPLCGRFLFAQVGCPVLGHRYEPSHVEHSASQVPSEFL